MASLSTEHRTVTIGVSIDGRPPIDMYDSHACSPWTAMASALRFLAVSRLTDPATRYTLHLTVADLFGNTMTVTSDQLEDAGLALMDETAAVAA
jgi:hypothetical protein